MSEEFETPKSRIEAILQNMLGAENTLPTPQTRIEWYLQKILEEGPGESHISWDGQYDLETGIKIGDLIIDGVKNPIYSPIQIAYCIYDTTTYAQIDDILTNGKFPICNYNNISYKYTGNIESKHVFTSIYGNFIYELFVSYDSDTGNTIWESVTKNSESIFFCTSTTTYAQVTSILNSGRIPVYYYNNIILLKYTGNTGANTPYIFTAIYGTTTWSITLDSLNNWSSLTTTKVVANESLSGTEDSLTELTVGGTKYKVSSVLTFNNIQVSNWTSDNTYADYPYRASVALTDVTASMYGDVIFSLEDSISGKYAPIAETFNGGVYLYSTVDTEITIPTFIFWR